MVATAGRVKRPPNNRLSISEDLGQRDRWKNDIVKESQDDVNTLERDNEMRLRRHKALARATGTEDYNPGSCKHCGEIGHLSFQCRNMFQLAVERELNVQLKSDSDVDEPEDIVPHLRQNDQQSPRPEMYPLISDPRRKRRKKRTKSVVLSEEGEVDHYKRDDYERRRSVSPRRQRRSRSRSPRYRIPRSRSPRSRSPVQYQRK